MQHVQHALRSSGAIRAVCIIALYAVWLGVTATPGAAAEPAIPDALVAVADEMTAQPPPDAEPFDNPYAEMDLDELMAVQVTSVAGTEQDWFKTPAAMYVISGEDIRRSGHQHIAEALRLAPGVHVGRLTSNKWAVGVRGFTERYASKLLVLKDGRMLYNPAFSGVYWEHVDAILEDIDRIEVIRGPGATLWGVNAVNGVINIESKPADQTQGLYVTGLVGNELRAVGAARYGGRLDDDTSYRVWTKYREHDELTGPFGADRPDDWNSWRSGVRIDHDHDADTRVTFESELAGSENLGERTTRPNPAVPLSTTEIIGDGRFFTAYARAKLDHTRDDGSRIELQGIYDHYQHGLADGYHEQVHTIRIDFRHHLQPMGPHRWIWGLAWKHDRLHIKRSPGLAIKPSSVARDQFSAFVQDTITIAPDELFAMVGSKLGHNEYTGFEVQPSARLWWTPTDEQTLWAAVSRAVRIPSATDEGLDLTLAYLPMPPGGRVGGGGGGGGIRSEKLMAYELGYRWIPDPSISLDVAGFYNRYDDLLLTSTTNPFTIDNRAVGHSGGVEVAARWHVADNLSIDASYSLLQMDIDGQNFQDGDERAAPRNQAQLHAHLDVFEGLGLDGSVYYVGNTNSAPAYVRLDLGATWHPTEQLELSIRGQNLLEPTHPEFDTLKVPDLRTEIERSVYVQATYRF